MYSRSPLVLLFCLISFFGRSAYDYPPDTTSSIIDRSASIVLIEQGKEFYTKGLYKSALAKFREAGNKDPNYWKPAFWISQCHYNLDNYGLSMKYAREAVRLDDNELDKEVYELLGRAYHRMGNIDSAMVFYSKAIEVLPGFRSKELSLDLRLDQCRFAKESLSK